MIKKNDLLVVALCGTVAACSSSGLYTKEKTEPEVVEPPELLESEFGLELEPDLIEIAETPTKTISEPELVVEDAPEPQDETAVETDEKKESAPVVEVKSEPAEEVAEDISEPEPEMVVVTIPDSQPEAEVITEAKSETESGSFPMKTSEGKLILGSVEWVYVPGLNQSFSATVATDKQESVLRVAEMLYFKRNDRDWVKFRVADGETKSEEISLPVVRRSNKRPVISSWIQVGELLEETNFTLADDIQLKTPIVLGRSFFSKFAILDPDREYIQPKIQN